MNDILDIIVTSLMLLKMFIIVFLEILWAFKEIVIILIVILFFTIYNQYKKFVKSKYKDESGHSFLKTHLNVGAYGEYLTFGVLEKLEGNKKILTNVYLPKEDGSTTEIDLIMIHETGIYVFESKNYSGWIYGNSREKMWTQTFRSGQKNKFLNPIWQNFGHIEQLKRIIPEYENYIFKSYIIFSERCSLKKITYDMKENKIINRNSLYKIIKEDVENSATILNQEDINHLYQLLSRFVRVENTVKEKHIQNIQLKS